MSYAKLTNRGCQNKNKRDALQEMWHHLNQISFAKSSAVITRGNVKKQNHAKMETIF